ncbi:EF-hand domain-containing protein [Thalassomonas viridans]|uniref:EF-hand domain-containing protein n=1 Tax=Thalassomonas viridans TaxID=137584 RepID=A0AAE9Z110_9GAMM|nr:EF-hand domain-containing protein [Thalassomonas viridans]WDE04070.1 EF-hand domain-containing protein [Thalassomonas viridans]
MMKIFTIKQLPLFALALCSHLSLASGNDYGQNERHERRGPPPFSQLDLDGDNGITLDEFSQHPIPRGEHETVFNHIDSNGDGTITETELTSHKPPRKPRNSN